MLKKMKLVGCLLLLGTAVSSAACTVEMGSAEEAEGESGVESVLQPIGEAGCGSMDCTSANSCAALNVNQCAPSNTTLSPLSYGSASCPGQFVVRDMSPPTNGGRIIPIEHWRGATLTAANCASARLEGALYARVGNAASATLVGTDLFTGVWNGTSCTLWGNGQKPFVVPSTNLKEVRATGKATLGGVPQRVEVGFWHVC
jgi:hypothetical protein